MSPSQLAEAYEKLKELRRRGGLPKGLSEWSTNPGEETGPKAPPIVGQAWRESIIEWMRAYDLYGSLAIHKAKELDIIETSASVVRNLEMRVLAHRIFGDEVKAEAWLNRANPSLSGQKPVDLLNDELGAAVVREALEQIDHGIFA